jgi:hypothetical protein
MAISYPTSIDVLTNPTATDQVGVVSHSLQHANANDAIEALEAKVGANGSAVTTSHDYKLGEILTTDKAVGKTATQTLTNKTLTAPTIATITNTGTLTLPTSTDTLVGRNTTDTLTNKTLTTPTIVAAGFTNMQHAHDAASTGGQLNATNVFSAGTVPTARLGSGTANNTTYLRGDQTWQPLVSTGKFGGTGADGALSITSGTTTVDLAGAAYYEKNYTTISITGTGQLVFINGATNGSTVVLRATGNVALTSSATPNINVTGIGGAGGTAANNTGALISSNPGSGIHNTGAPYRIGLSANVAGQNGSNTGGFNWNRYAINGSSAYPIDVTATVLPAPSVYSFPLPGGGGSGAVFNSGGGSTGGDGGRGGGALSLECAGFLNFTGTIYSNGVAGGAGTAAGGNGAGGQVRVLYNSLTSAAGTITTSAVGNAGQSFIGTNTLYL